MRRIVFVLLLIVIASLNVSAKGTAKKTAPVIVLTETTWDFGKLPEGKILRRDVLITNKGNKTLEIESLIEGCGCLTVSIDKTKILPGKQAKMKVEYDSTGSSGEIERTVQIMSNDPKNPVLIYSIKGIVE
jgi:hypothetical protein